MTIRYIVLLLIGIALIIAAFMVIGFGSNDKCSKYPDPEKEPVSTEQYFDIPLECINQTQLFPDERATVGTITYIYHEMPEMGAATISTEDIQGPYVFVYIIEKAMYIRGRYVINDTHNRFLKLGKVIE